MVSDVIIRLYTYISPQKVMKNKEISCYIQLIDRLLQCSLLNLLVLIYV